MARRGYVMAGCMWVLLCVAAAQATATQDTNPSHDLQKRREPGSATTSVGDVRLGGPGDGAESPREARSPPAPPLPPAPEGDASFWLARGKRPADPLDRHSRVSDGDTADPWGHEDEDDDDDSEEEDESVKLSGRSGSGTFWVARGKKALQDYLSYYWGSNQNVWGETPFQRWASSGGMEDPAGPQQDHTSRSSLGSGWESNQSFWGKRDGGPFWIARGKRTTPASSSSSLFSKRQDDGGPFWISRGKKSESLPPLDEPFLWPTRGRKSAEARTFWAARGKKEVTARAPFWIARGKRGGSEASLTAPFWIARGKKDGEMSPIWIARGKEEGETHPFWVARGKKEGETHPFWVARGKKEGETHPFWVARGKKEGEAHPFWVARGKKEGETHPFWVARGKKEGETHPFWIARGKKESERHPFWVARGKREEDNSSFWITRGKKEDTHPFWVARGKKEGDRDPYWIARGKKEPENNAFWAARGRRTDGEQDLLMEYLLQALLVGQAEASRRHDDPDTQDDPFATSFVAQRG
ncbi:uncharacterized protein [Panulirus ornatus]|uniref:uncharacterized protein n=1 Tax=Panulirus ornatus TaxID=150431 RepID=UPI003A894981